MSIGNYLIMETDDGGDVVDMVPIYYRMAGPLEFNAQGEAGFRCEVSLDGQDFPTGVQGQAAGFVGNYPAPEVSPTAIKSMARNVFTFGPSTVMPGLGPDEFTDDIPLLK